MMGHADIRTTGGYVSPDESAIRAALDTMPMPMPAEVAPKVAPKSKNAA